MRANQSEDPVPPIATEPCPLCSSAGRPAFAALVFERGDVRIEIDHVPVITCAQCGEDVVSGPLALVIGDTVEDLFGALSGMAQGHAGFMPRSLVIEARELASA